MSNEYLESRGGSVHVAMCVDTVERDRRRQGLVALERHAFVQVFAHKWHHTNNVMPYTFAAQLPSDVVIEPAVAGRAIGGPGTPRGPGAVAAIPRSPYLVTAGHWDCSVRVFDFETGALKQSATAHRAPVTCVSIATSAPPVSPFVAPAAISTHLHSGRAHGSGVAMVARETYPQHFR